MSEAEGRWQRGDALGAGRLIYERLGPRQRPGWAVGVLDACCEGLPDLPPEVLAVRQIALTPARWGEAHDAFSDVRAIVLAVERGELVVSALMKGVLYLTECVAKVAYNASGRPAPFDHDAGWWVAKNARQILERSTDPGLEARVWAALVGPVPPCGERRGS